MQSGAGAGLPGCLCVLSNADVCIARYCYLLAWKCGRELLRLDSQRLPVAPNKAVLYHKLCIIIQ
jgi:hypothetical protein